MPFLLDGFRTTISFVGSFGGTFIFMEKEVMPPSNDLGGPIDITTMRNQSFRIKWKKSLINFDEVTLQVSYDPRDIVTVQNFLLGFVTNITILFPDGSTVVFVGWLESFKPASLKEGEFPLAEMKIHITNCTTGVNGAPQESLPSNPVQGTGFRYAGPAFNPAPPAPFGQV